MFLLFSLCFSKIVKISKTVYIRIGDENILERCIQFTKQRSDRLREVYLFSKRVKESFSQLGFSKIDKIFQTVYIITGVENILRRFFQLTQQRSDHLNEISLLGKM
jgi:citrate lyase synthetase